MAAVTLPGISDCSLPICSRALGQRANVECQADMPGTLAAAMFLTFY